MPPRRAARAGSGPPATRSQLPKDVVRALKQLPEAAERLVGRKLPALSAPKLRELRDAVDEINDYVQADDVHAVAVLEELQARGSIAAGMVALVGCALRKVATASSDPREQQLHQLGTLTVDVVAGLLKAARTAQATTVAREAACALASALFKTQVLHAAARQAASGVEALRHTGSVGAPSAGAAARAAEASDMRLRIRVGQQAVTALQLVRALCDLIETYEDKALATSLLRALRGSHVLDHASQVVVRLAMFRVHPGPRPAGCRPPAEAVELAGVQAEGLVSLCQALSDAESVIQGQVGNLEAVVEEVLGPCSRQAVLVLGTAALAKADGGRWGLAVPPLIAAPEEGSHALPTLDRSPILMLLTRLAYDQRQPHPAVAPRAALRLLTRVMRLASASYVATTTPGAVTRGPGGEMRVDVSWAGGRRAETQEYRMLLPGQLVGGLTMHAAMAQQELALRRPQAWAAEAAQTWGPLVTAVRHAMAVADDEVDRNTGPTFLAAALDLARQGLLPADGQAPPLFFSPAQLPVSVAAALEGGVVPLFETLLRVAGEDPSSPEAAIVGNVFSRPEPRQCIASLAAHSPPRQAAAFAATLAKLLRKTHARPLLQSLSVDGEGQSGSTFPALQAAMGILDLSLAALDSAQASEEPAGPVDPACAPVLALSSAALQLLPEVMRLTQQTTAIMLAQWEALLGAKEFLITPTHITPICITLRALVSALGPVAGSTAPAGPVDGGGVRGMGGASLLPGKPAVRWAGQSRPAHRLASAVCLPFLVEEFGAVPLLGSLLNLAWRLGTFPGVPSLGAKRNSLLAKACLGVYATYPQHVQRAGGGSGPGVSAEGRFSWQPVALRALAGMLKGTERVLSREVLSLAAKLEARSGAGASAQSEPMAALTAEAERLAAVKAEARALLPACANPACVNLAGDSEAGLKLLRCSSCKSVSYCCGECQAAHWKAGHKAVCGGKGG